MNIKIIAIACGLSLSACGTLGPRAHELGAKANPPPLTLPERHQTIYTGAIGNQGLAYYLIGESDIRCENYLVGVAIARNGTDAGLSVSAQALSTIGGLVAPGSAANAFSGASTFVQGTNRTLNDTIFSGQDFHVVYTAVKRGRDRLREDLVRDIDAGRWDTLPHEGVLSRVVPYDLNCGLTFGMNELARAVARDD